MRHRDYTIGVRAIKRVPLPLVNVPSGTDPATDAAIRPPGSTSGALAVSEPMVIGIMCLTGTECSLVLRKAGEFSKANGGTGLQDDPQHVLGVQVYTLAIACVEPDSDPKRPAPFFGEPGDIDSAAQEILNSLHLGRDGIAYLMDHQEMWQEQCSPQSQKITLEQLIQIATESANRDDPRGFLALRPGTRWSCFRSMAQQWLSLLTDKSSGGQSWPSDLATRSEQPA